MEYDEELGSSEVADIVQMVIESIDGIAADTDGPGFQEIVGARIKQYAEFTNRIMSAETSAETNAIIGEYPAAKELNDKVQEYIKLANRGIVTIDPSENVRQHVYHALVQEISDEESAALMAGLDKEIDYSDFHCVANNVITSAAAGQLLGGIKFWADIDVLGPEEYALVHPISSTKH